MRVGVVFGGDGAERDVSRASAAQIIPALRRRGHSVVAIDATEGRISNTDESRCLTTVVSPAFPPTIERSSAQKRAATLRILEAVVDLDVVFLAMHGGPAEDGRLPALFDLCGVPCTGSDYLSGGVCMDKDISKRLYRDAGIATPDWLVEPESAYFVANHLDFPVVVKPISEGSTVGISAPTTIAELQSALYDAAQYGRVFVEAFIGGRELTVGVLGDRALAVGEIVLPDNEALFGYELKYQGTVIERFPASIPGETADEARSIAMAAHRALGLSGYSRSDFILDTSERLWIMETNNLPGMTSTSLLPQSAAAAGIGYDELCERICRLAIETPTSSDDSL